MNEDQTNALLDALAEANQNLQTLGFLKELEVRVAIDSLGVKVNPGGFGLRHKSFDDYKAIILEEAEKQETLDSQQ